MESFIKTHLEDEENRKSNLTILVHEVNSPDILPEVRDNLKGDETSITECTLSAKNMGEIDLLFKSTVQTIIAYLGENEPTMSKVDIIKRLFGILFEVHHELPKEEQDVQGIKEKLFMLLSKAQFFYDIKNNPGKIADKIATAIVNRMKGGKEQPPLTKEKDVDSSLN